MSSWLITSFGLPVATTTGRLLDRTLSGLPGHLIVMAMIVVGLTTAVMGGRAALHLLHRRGSRRGSNS
jgi:hypothetical protein